MHCKSTNWHLRTKTLVFRKGMTTLNRPELADRAFKTHRKVQAPQGIQAVKPITNESKGKINHRLHASSLLFLSREEITCLGRAGEGGGAERKGQRIHQKWSISGQLGIFIRGSDKNRQQFIILWIPSGTITGAKMHALLQLRLALPSLVHSEIFKDLCLNQRWRPMQCLRGHRLSSISF